MLRLQEPRRNGDLSARWSSKCRLIRADAFAGPSGTQPAPSLCGSPIAIANSVNAQRATGSAYLVEPIFHRGCFEIISGKPATSTHVSEEAESGSLLISARPAVQSRFWILNDFPRYWRLRWNIRRPELVRPHAPDVSTHLPELSSKKHGHSCRFQCVSRACHAQ